MNYNKRILVRTNIHNFQAFSSIQQERYLCPHRILTKGQGLIILQVRKNCKGLTQETGTFNWKENCLNFFWKPVTSPDIRNLNHFMLIGSEDSALLCIRRYNLREKLAVLAQNCLAHLQAKQQKFTHLKKMIVHVFHFSEKESQKIFLQIQTIMNFRTL